MTHADTRAVLSEITRLEHVARRSRTDVWFPLLVFGLICVPGSALAWIIGRDHLGLYFLPMHLLGGVMCAWYYRSVGRTTGLQMSLFLWLTVILGATMLAAAASALGREYGSDTLNLAGPTVALLAGYSLLALWSRSATLLLLVAGIGATAVIVLRVATGDTAIGLQLAGFAVLMLSLAVANYQQSRRLA